jgi:hypothetical protein
MGNSNDKNGVGDLNLQPRIIPDCRIYLLSRTDPEHLGFTNWTDA